MELHTSRKLVQLEKTRRVAFDRPGCQLLFADWYLSKGMAIREAFTRARADSGMGAVVQVQQAVPLRH